MPIAVQVCDPTRQCVTTKVAVVLKIPKQTMEGKWGHVGFCDCCSRNLSLSFMNYKQGIRCEKLSPAKMPDYNL